MKGVSPELMIGVVAVVIVLFMGIFSFAIAGEQSGSLYSAWESFKQFLFGSDPEQADVKAAKLSAEALACAIDTVATGRAQADCMSFYTDEAPKTGVMQDPKIKCKDDYSGCNLYNFNLPQRFEGVSGTAKEWITGHGDPNFLVYWQSFPEGVDRAWTEQFTWENNILVDAVDVAFAWWGAGKILKIGGKALWRGVGKLAAREAEQQMQLELFKMSAKAEFKTKIDDLARKISSHLSKEEITKLSKRGLLATSLVAMFINSYTAKYETEPQSVVYKMPYDDPEPNKLDTKMPVFLLGKSGEKEVEKRTLYFASPCNANMFIENRTVTCEQYSYRFADGTYVCNGPEIGEYQPETGMLEMCPHSISDGFDKEFYKTIPQKLEALDTREELKIYDKFEEGESSLEDYTPESYVIKDPLTGLYFEFIFTEKVKRDDLFEQYPDMAGYVEDLETDEFRLNRIFFEKDGETVNFFVNEDGEILAGEKALKNGKMKEYKCTRVKKSDGRLLWECKAEFDPNMEPNIDYVWVGSWEAGECNEEEGWDNTSYDYEDPFLEIEGEVSETEKKWWREMWEHIKDVFRRESAGAPCPGPKPGEKSICCWKNYCDEDCQKLVYGKTGAGGLEGIRAYNSILSIIVIDEDSGEEIEQTMERIELVSFYDKEYFWAFYTDLEGDSYAETIGMGYKDFDEKTWIGKLYENIKEFFSKNVDVTLTDEDKDGKMDFISKEDCKLHGIAAIAERNRIDDTNFCFVEKAWIQPYLDWAPEICMAAGTVTGGIVGGIVGFGGGAIPGAALGLKVGTLAGGVAATGNFVYKFIGDRKDVWPGGEM